MVSFPFFLPIVFAGYNFPTGCGWISAIAARTFATASSLVVLVAEELMSQFNLVREGGRGDAII